MDSCILSYFFLLTFHLSIFIFLLIVLQSHKGATACRNKSFPHYEDFYIVYANDHATVKDAQTPANIFEKLEVQKSDDKLDDVHEDVDCT